MHTQDIGEVDPSNRFGSKCKSVQLLRKNWRLEEILVMLFGDLDTYN